MLGQETEAGRRSNACGLSGLQLHLAPVESGKLHRFVTCQSLGETGILGRPGIELAAAARHDLAQTLGALGVEFGHLRPDHPWILGVSAHVAHGGGDIGSRLRQRLAMGRDSAFERCPVGLHDAAGHHRVPDDERRTFTLLDCDLESGGHGLGIAAVDVKHVPVPSAVFGRDILRVDGIDLGRELHVVGVIEHDEVVQAQMAGDAPRTLRDFLLNAAVGDERIGLVRDDLAEAGGEEPLGNRAADGHDMTLAQRAG